MAKPIRYKHGWRVNFRHKGQKYRKRFAGGPEAKGIAEEYIERITAGDFPQGDFRQLEQIILEYHRWSEKIKGKADSTMWHQRHVLSVLSEWMKARSLELIRFSQNEMRQFQDYYFRHAPFYRKKNYRPRSSSHRATWNYWRQCVSAFFAWCIRLGYMDSNPATASEFKLKTDTQPIRIIKPDELRKIFEFLDEYDQHARVPYGTFFRCLLYTGMRRNELVNLKWQDVSLRKRKITVVASKTGQPRTIPISSKLLPYLESLLTRDNTYLFDSGRNEPLYRSNRYWKILRMATGAAGLRDIRIHDLRHTFAANLAMASVPIGIIQKLLGHKHLKYTQIYIDFYPERFQESIERLDFEGSTS